MNKKIILWILMLITLVSIVQALVVTDEDIIGFWLLNDSSTNIIDYKDNSRPQYNLTYNGVLNQRQNLAPYNNFSLGFDGSNDYATDNSALNTVLYDNKQDRTVSCWINASDTTDNGVIGNTPSGAGSVGGWQMRQHSAGLLCRDYLDPTGERLATGSFSVGSTSMATCIFNSTGVYTYVNETLIASDIDSSTRLDATINFTIGNSAKNSNEWFVGNIESCVIYNRSLSSSDLSDLYTSGLLSTSISLNYPSQGQSFTTDYIGNINFSVTSSSNNCSLNNSLWDYNSKVGEAYNFINNSNIPSGNYDINITCDPTSGNNISTVLSFSIDTTPPTITSSLSTNLTNFSINVTYDFTLTDSNLDNFSINDSCGNVANQTGLSSPFTYHQNFSLLSCSLGSNDVTITSCDTSANCQVVDYSYVITPGLEIRLFNQYGVAISNFTVTVNGSLNGNTTGEVYTVKGLQQENYQIEVDNNDYVSSTLNITLSSILDTLNFTVLEQNTFNLNFFYESNYSSADGLVIDVDLISNSLTNNYTVTNGTLFANLLIPDTYTIRYEAPGYNERFYYTVLNTDSFENLTLYLVQNTSVSTITVNVVDEIGNEVEDVYVKVLRFNQNTNAYEISEIIKTNFEGEANFEGILNDEFYKFILEKPLGTVKLVTSPTQLLTTNLNFQIRIQEEALQDYYVQNDITHSLTFNSATNNFKLTYSDPSNTVIEMCLNAYLVQAKKETLFNSSCSTSTSGTILVGINNATGTSYRAVAFVTRSSSPTKVLIELYKDFVKSDTFGNLGVTLILFMTIIFATIALYDRTIALVITPLPLMVGSIVGLWNIPLSISVIPFIVCIIIAVIISRN